MEKLDGLIIKGIGGFYYVEAAGAVYECKARGVFRKEKISPLVGDYVTICVQTNGENTIDVIKARKNDLKRPPVANLDQLLIVVATCEPTPSTLIIDKMIAIACHKNIEPIIVINKADLRDAKSLAEIYALAGLKTIVVSAQTGESVEQIKAVLPGKISAFTGNSGVGKSTILNAIDPRLTLATGEISEKLGRGRHTTRETQLFSIAGGYVADTPGFAALDFEKSELITKEELPLCFSEFEEYLGTCQFTSCAHIQDKGCSIVEAVKEGKISKSRHDSYKAMYDEVKDIKEWER